jgi:Fe-S-cluster containining protein
VIRDLPENLCTNCGLCCDGSLFAEVELRSRRESIKLESIGLEVEEDDDGDLLLQPCGALKGTRCSIYHFRPGCCRTFECRLLRDVEEGKRTMAEALEVIQGTRQLIAEVVSDFAAERAFQPLPLKEQYFEALEQCDESDTQKLAHLKDAMRRLEHRIEVNFLR